MTFLWADLGLEMYHRLWEWKFQYYLKYKKPLKFLRENLIVPQSDGMLPQYNGAPGGVGYKLEEAWSKGNSSEIKDYYPNEEIEMASSPRFSMSRPSPDRRSSMSKSNKFSLKPLPFGSARKLSLHLSTGPSGALKTHLGLGKVKNLKHDERKLSVFSKEIVADRERPRRGSLPPGGQGFNKISNKDSSPSKGSRSGLKHPTVHHSLRRKSHDAVP